MRYSCSAGGRRQVGFARRNQTIERLARLDQPVPDEHQFELLDRGSSDSNHGIDPLTNPRVVLEITRVDQVEAAGERDTPVDDNDSLWVGGASAG